MPRTGAPVAPDLGLGILTFGFARMLPGWLDPAPRVRELPGGLAAMLASQEDGDGHAASDALQQSVAADGATRGL
jgi:hypothetical protein